jgi:hypothetical protein
MNDSVSPADAPGWLEVKTPQGSHFVKIERIASVKARPDGKGCVLVMSEGKDLFLDLDSSEVLSVVNDCAKTMHEKKVYTTKETLLSALHGLIDGHHVEDNNEE